VAIGGIFGKRQNAVVNVRMVEKVKPSAAMREAGLNEPLIAKR
jgi:hypothetical protein